MYKFLTNNGQRIAFGVGVLITIIFIGSAVSGLDSFNALPEDQQETTTIFDFGLGATIVLFVIALVLMVFFGIYQVVDDPKGSMKGLIGLAILVVIFLIAYFTAPDTVSNPALETSVEKAGGVSPGALKWISGSITTMLALLGGAVLALVVSEVMNFFK